MRPNGRRRRRSRYNLYQERLIGTSMSVQTAGEKRDWRRAGRRTGLTLLAATGNGRALGGEHCGRRSAEGSVATNDLVNSVASGKHNQATFQPRCGAGNFISTALVSTKFQHILTETCTAFRLASPMIITSQHLEYQLLHLHSRTVGTWLMRCAPHQRRLLKVTDTRISADSVARQGCNSA